MTLADATDRLMAERDENTCRKAFTASELVALGRQLEELERPKAQERQRESGGDRRSDQYRSSSADDNRSNSKKTNQVVGNALGVSQSTYERAKTVVNATENADPQVAEVAREQLAKLDAGRTSYVAADRAEGVEDDDYRSPGVAFVTTHSL
ncbi:hypothetical protein [Mycobacteroides abscessus]|uniref:hypothetical protein n=1 Tax=Mycobacteroides abscessus TaxID=36809 RepID=UPI0013000817|nr:hypothetical protein [Mycobacteroides abscessus]